MMPFLHLPIQAGSDKILKSMNRKHSKEFYIKLIKKIRNKVKDIAFSSDFIVGYPGETDLDFQDTLDLIDKVKFASSYSFKYSARPGTPASVRTNQVCEGKSEHTHHINEQQFADKDGNFDNFHKNIKHNLIQLCEKCHNEVHNGDLDIYGYLKGLNGKNIHTNCV